MAGHSKWNNIKRRKGAVDAERAKLFTKLGREIQVAVKSGGPDPETNNQLKDVIAKAKSNNMPNDNIQRSIKKASGAGNTDHFDAIDYEGYGPSGVALIVRALTDNRNRTAGDVRHGFDKFGGNMGQQGSVSFMFEDKGVIVLEKELIEDEEQFMMDLLESGADDYEDEDEFITVYTQPADFRGVRENLEAHGYEFAQAEVQPVPNNWVTVEDEDTRGSLQKMIDYFDDNDDVQAVYHNWENED